MELYFLVKTLHILSSTILFGTGIGIAFFMFRSIYSKSVQEKYYIAKGTVQADYIFTLPATLIQPISGFMLIYISGVDWMSYWLKVTYLLYIMVVVSWIIVVIIQIRLKKLCSEAYNNGTELHSEYMLLFKVWMALGCPAFIGLLTIFYLMVAKPIGT